MCSNVLLLLNMLLVVLLNHRAFKNVFWGILFYIKIFSPVCSLFLGKQNFLVFIKPSYYHFSVMISDFYIVSIFTSTKVIKIFFFLLER